MKNNIRKLKFFLKNNRKHEVITILYMERKKVL